MSLVAGYVTCSNNNNNNNPICKAPECQKTSVVLSSVVVKVLLKYCAVLLCIVWHCVFMYSNIVDRLQSGVVYNLTHVCLSVCLSVRQIITFASLDVGSS